MSLAADLKDNWSHRGDLVGEAQHLFHQVYLALHALNNSIFKIIIDSVTFLCHSTITLV